MYCFCTWVRASMPCSTIGNCCQGTDLQPLDSFSAEENREVQCVLLQAFTPAWLPCVGWSADTQTTTGRDSVNWAALARRPGGPWLSCCHTAGPSWTGWSSQ